MNYKLKYYNHFGLQECDPVFCEYNYIVNGIYVPAVNIHHVLFGKGKKDNNIINLMAVSYQVHQDAHNEKLNRYDLKEIHLQFMKCNPY